MDEALRVAEERNDPAYGLRYALLPLYPNREVVTAEELLQLKRRWPLPGDYKPFDYGRCQRMAEEFGIECDFPDAWRLLEFGVWQPTTFEPGQVYDMQIDAVEPGLVHVTHDRRAFLEDNAEPKYDRKQKMWHPGTTADCLHCVWRVSATACATSPSCCLLATYAHSHFPAVYRLLRHSALYSAG